MAPFCMSINDLKSGLAFPLFHSMQASIVEIIGVMCRGLDMGTTGLNSWLGYHTQLNVAFSVSVAHQLYIVKD